MNQEDLDGVIDHLRGISFYLEMDPDATHWQSSAYSDAAETLENQSPDVLEDILESHEDINNVGDKIASIIEEYLERGTSERYEGLDEQFPDIRELARVEGLGVKTARRIHETLEIETLDELEEACEKGLLSEHVPRVGTTTEENYLEEIEEVRIGAQDRKPWGQVESYWKGIETRLRRLNDPAFAELKGIEVVERVTPAGSFRRAEDTVGDLDVLIEANPDDASVIFDYMSNWSVCDKVLRKGDEKMSYRSDALQVDLLIVPTEMYGAALQYFTGSVAHNIKVRERALDRGLTVSEHGVHEVEGRDEDGDIIKGDRVAGETEEEVYGVLDMEVPDPTERDDRDIEEWVVE